MPHRITSSRVILGLALLIAPSTLSAQYFGRQKVQYEDFDWKILPTTHFDVHFYPEEQVVSTDAARMAERWYLRLSRAFQHEFKKKPLIFYADHPDFQQTNVIGGMLSEGTGGVTEGLRNRVIMPFTGVYRDNDHVLGHELVHVFQYDLASSPGGGGLAGMGRLPLWLVEGMAEYLSLGRDDPHTAMWLRDSALRGELPTIDQLTRDPRFFPYRYGQALWAYIGGRWGDRAVTELYRYATRAGWDAALQRVLGLSSAGLSSQWITAIRSTYLPVIQGRQRPKDAGQPVLFSDEIGAMHLSPVVSPDGRYVAYFGRRELFTVDLYVADSRTGQTVKKLTSPNRNAHFDALSFIQSAGTWSPDGRKFAFIVFADGDNELAILDVDSGDLERQVGVEGAGSLQNPAWSPDGTRIAFSGVKGGLSDLYMMDVASGQVQQITDDRYADLQPTWSPDGRNVAFVTDRGPGTDFTRLVFGEMNIALYDVNTRAVRVLDLFEGAKHVNPQYSPDGTELFFIADREGFSDIYRYELSSNNLFQVTRLATGVSGITSLSPALSVAQRSGRVMFSVFENSGHNVYGLELQDARGTAVTRTAATRAIAGILPPVEAVGSGMIAEYLADPVSGLPTQEQFAIKDYKPKLSLEYLGQPSFGVGVGGYTGGATLGGGVSAYFGDMLGNHTLGVAVQAQGTLKDIGGQAIYQNAQNRINWAAVIGHIPYLTGFTSVGPLTSTGGIASRRVQQVLERVFVDQAQAFAFYPLSTTRRFELSGGFTRYSYDREVHEFLVALNGQILDEERSSAPTPAALNLMEGSLAFVGDNSYFGFTSPVAGQRFRVEVTPTFGSLQFSSLLADYRRYVFMRPASFAFRALHYGRYGAAAEDGRLSPLFLGYETLVRGYSIESFDVSECTDGVNSDQTCPEFDRMVGSKIGVVNLELRLPLIGTDELGLINFPFLPTEIAPFIDAGVAWDSDRSPDFRFERSSTALNIPVVSAGVSARFNVLGYLVLEAYYAYPFQRPRQGWHLGFNIAPGW
ncbi:MAG: peptidase S9 [Longimicrobiales bacterium]